MLQRSSIYETRTLIWTIGIDKIVEKPILGIGQENFELILEPETINQEWIKYCKSAI